MAMAGYRLGQFGAGIPEAGHGCQGNYGSIKCAAYRQLMLSQWTLACSKMLLSVRTTAADKVVRGSSYTPWCTSAWQHLRRSEALWEPLGQELERLR